MTDNGSAWDPRAAWPALPWREWEPSMATLHMWVQIVGKVRMALAPPLNHWWHVPLYVTARGLTSSPIPYEARVFQVDFDFLDHRVLVTDSLGGAFTVALKPKSVARFYREFMGGLRDLGIDVRISTQPVEVADATPFEEDEHHAAYDPGHAEAFWRGLLQADRVIKAFQSGFVGKASPVQFFWGSFDLAASRYSGRPAPLHRGGAPNCGTWVMQEAYAREEHSIGWWPASSPPGPAFYAYVYPEPDGLRAAPLRPAGASFDARSAEFILPYDVVRQAADPDAAAQAFFQSTYDAGADLASWDRALLEPRVPPDRPPTRPWSTVPTPGDALPRATHRHLSRQRPEERR